MKRIRIRTPAKINLFLRVLNRRADGYHEIETLFQAIDLYDELLIEETGTGFALEVPGYPELETEDNLVVRAVRQFEQLTSRPVEARIVLNKLIPTAAGLGGGSSDAAATLLGLRHLLIDEMPVTDLVPVAAKLGADVPFFLHGGTAIGEGIGDRLTPVSINTDYSLLMINPGVPVSTAQVYAGLPSTLTAMPRVGILRGKLDKKQPLDGLLFNDLQSIAEKIRPEIVIVRRYLEQMPSEGVLMSGSGPTVFAVLAEADHVLSLDLTGTSSQWRVFRARPVMGGPVID
jgi:4-diphosphocytidyl-2-C-methyl-D-erythritol kinase